MSKEYEVPLVPGPTSVPENVRRAYFTNYGSADLEDSFFELYSETSKNVQQLLNAHNSTVVIMSGEGMVALWGAVKSVVKPGDKVLCVSNGLFGDGFSEMAQACGCETRLVKCPEGDSPNSEEVFRVALEFKPKVITMVQCETPSGILNPVAPIGQIAKEVGAIFLIDFVSSAGSTQVDVDGWGIDLGLLGTQKCLSCLPDLGIVTVSEKAWDAVRDVKYCGYDALLPFEKALESKYFPYTPNWHAISALNVSLNQLVNVEGVEASIRRHAEVAKHCREEIRKLGLKTFPLREELNAPSVTAVWVPQGWEWSQLDKKLRERGVVLGGTFGPLTQKIFRIGHMGSQARIELVDKAVKALKEVLESKH